MTHGPAASRFFLGLGIAYVAAGLLCNEVLLARLLGTPEVFAVPSNRVALLLFNVALVGVGLVTIGYRRRAFVANLNLVVVSLAVAVMLGEALVRVYEPPPLRRVMDPYLHHTLPANAEGVTYWGASKTRYATNALGYRDRRIRDVPRSDSTRTRILLLGDSFTEGIGVAYDDSFAAVLERLLQQRGHPAEVLNAGLSSYSPRLCYRKLEQFYAGGYTTDAVVLMLDLSDIRNEGVHYKGWERFSDEAMRAYRSRERRRSRFSPRLPSFVRQRVRALLDQTPTAPPPEPDAGASLHTQDPFSEELYRDTSAPWKDDGIRICKEYILRLARLSRQHGARFALAIYPHPQHLRDPSSAAAYRDVFAGFAQKHDITLYDLFPTFLALDRPQDYYIRGDIHWTEKGHALVGRLLAEGLEASMREADQPAF